MSICFEDYTESSNIMASFSAMAGDLPSIAFSKISYLKCTITSFSILQINNSTVNLDESLAKDIPVPGQVMHWGHVAEGTVFRIMA